MRFAQLRPLYRSLLALGFAAGLVGCDGADKPAVKKLAQAAAVDEKPAPVPAPTPVVAASAPDAGMVPHAAAVVEPPTEPKATEGSIDEAPPIVLPATFDERMQLGKKLAKKGQTDDALVAFEGASALNPGSERPHIEMARVLIAAGEMKPARVHADQATALAPTSSAAWNTKGRICFAEKEFDSSIYAFTKATQANGDNAFAWNNLGLALIAKENWDDAIVALETATGLPRPEPYMFANLGSAYEHAGRVAEARTAYKQGAARGSAESRKGLERIEELKASAAPAPTQE